MTTFDNTSVISTVKTAHETAERGGVTFNAGATVAAGNSGTWSRAAIDAALNAGSITASQKISIRNALAGYEQTQVDAARDTANLRGTYLAIS